MQFQKRNYGSSLGFGITLLKSPSIADPAGVYSYILYGNFCKWGFSITFGRG